MAHEHAQEQDRYDVAKIVALCGVSITMLTLLVVVGGCVVFSLYYPERELPEFLATTGAACIGFLFGSFFSLVKDFISTQPTVYDNRAATKESTL